MESLDTENNRNFQQENELKKYNTCHRIRENVGILTARIFGNKLNDKGNQGKNLGFALPQKGLTSCLVCNLYLYIKC